MDIVWNVSGRVSPRRPLHAFTPQDKASLNVTSALFSISSVSCYCHHRVRCLGIFSSSDLPRITHANMPQPTSLPARMADISFVRSRDYREASRRPPTSLSVPLEARCINRICAHVESHCILLLSLAYSFSCRMSSLICKFLAVQYLR